MPLTKKKIVGNIGEDAAARYLRENGYVVKARNVHLSHNELDIVAEDDEYIVFVEVKTRSVKSEDMYLPYGSPASAVTQGKRNRTVVAANNYLNSNRFSKHAKKQPRIDVVEIYLEDTPNGTKIKDRKHLEGAFDKNTAYKGYIPKGK